MKKVVEMFITEELRWFWQGESNVAMLKEWFFAESLHACGAGGPKSRTDEYLLFHSQTELGIKKRGGSNGVEIKRLIENQKKWWTFCLEAFGELNQVHQNLELVAKALATSQPPLPASGEGSSYPDWICKINTKGNPSE